mmetsp:Transcript_75902/g.122576  ORF Transcript_75902/g.122576 Transcript_75902/m.122576 type:complete len:211 (-) Transcript_75902:351-983(-)
MYIWLTSVPAAHPRAPFGGRELKLTVTEPFTPPTTLASSGPVTMCRTRVLFSATQVSFTQRSAHNFPDGVRRPAHSLSSTWNGATPVIGQRSKASRSTAALPSMICECQVSSRIVAAEPLKSPTRLLISRLCRRATKTTLSPWKNKAGLINDAPPASTEEHGILRSTISGPKRRSAGKSASCMATLGCGTKLNPTSIAARTKGTASLPFS